jgi:hypothetical protein
MTDKYVIECYTNEEMEKLILILILLDGLNGILLK